MEVKDASNECSTAGVNECTPYAYTDKTKEVALSVEILRDK